MKTKRIDLRSDTVTRPTPEMLQYMVQAEVGDDVFQEDPTVLAFEENMAKLFGMEAGLFVPSGTMSNQLGLTLLAGPGEEVLMDELGHVFNYETGAAAHLSSLQIRPLKGSRGLLSPDIVEAAIRPRNDWDPWTTVLALENTTNKGGGACYSKEQLIKLSETAKKQGLKLHLDGARIWNAITATGIEPEFFGTISDTMSICFSKGLGAPVGSMILSTDKGIRKARRFRKMWGGGMRQIGLLAAAAQYAVEHHWPLLKDDHRRAKLFAEHLSRKDGILLDPATVESNILIFKVGSETDEGAVLSSGGGHSGIPRQLSVDQILYAYKDHGIEMVPFGGNTIRATFHFQIDDQMLDQLLKVTDQIFN